MEAQQTHTWWQTGIIYEIYLRSFQDSNDDGIGDLKGIIQRLDYLQWLGVNVIWITPFYPSPMKDFGYDVADYTAIDPRFGTMEVFEELLTQLHKRNMKLIIDFVPNHTADQHPWFKESRSSKTNPKRNWYIWKDPKDGSPPNNWLSVLGGSAWQWDDHTNQYYYHAFLKEQPDLDLSNNDVQEAIAEVMRFWLDKGVDGFRIDVMWHLGKDKLFRDNPSNPNYEDSMPECDRLQQIYSCDRPEVHEIIARLRKVLDEYPDRLLMGEIYLPPEKTVAYYGKQHDGAHLPSNFQLLFLPWESRTIADAINKYESLLPDGAWPTWVIGNHDRPRLVSRISPEQCRIAAMLLLTLRGTPGLYYGDEIGIPQVQIPPEEVQDPQGLLMPGKNLSRDPQRTPMQWDQNANAGFTNGKPWLRLSEEYKKQNVLSQSQDEDSLLHFYKRLIAVRQREPSLLLGDYEKIFCNENILAFTRKTKGKDSYLVILNFSNKITSFNPVDFSFKGTVMVATSREFENDCVREGIRLLPNAGFVIRLD